MREFEIVFYEKPNGEEPVKEFLLSTEEKMRARIFRTLNLLATNGSDLRMPYSRHLTDGIFELRVKSGTDISRILYFFVIGKRIVLTNGFVKKTQKTPKSEIALAKKYRNEFLNRKDGSHDCL